MLSAILALSMVAPPQETLPLPRAEILRKLSAVPVFGVFNEAGQPMANSEKQIELFIEFSDADAFLKGVQEDSAIEGISVKTLRLDAVIQARTALEADGFTFVIKPNQDELTAANALWSSQGRIGEIVGVPIFVIGAKDRGYLQVQADGRPATPLFLKSDDAKKLRTDIVAANTELRDIARVEVTTLDTLLQMLAVNPSSETRPLTFIASKTALEQAKRLSEEGSQSSGLR